MQKKGHVPSAFSWVEIAVVLYFKGIMKFDAKILRWKIGTGLY